MWDVAELNLLAIRPEMTTLLKLFKVRLNIIVQLYGSWSHNIYVMIG